MILFPAIDLYGGKVVRLYKGDYDAMTVYSDDPTEVVLDFAKQGAAHVHIVDLEGARNGGTPNLSVIQKILWRTPLFVEVGGGIRDMETVQTYLSKGVSRVILGTAAVTDREFLKRAVEKYGDRIAVSADVKNGYIAIRGWLEQSSVTLDAFMEEMQNLGVCYVICTDISKDGAMMGTSLALYRDLSTKYRVHLTASGGVSNLSDIRALRAMGVYGAIVGKAYYTGALNLSEALEEAK